MMSMSPFGQVGCGRPLRELEKENPKEWSTVLIIALGSWEKTVPRGHS
jgi:hypothetical protein